MSWVTQHTVHLHSGTFLPVEPSMLGGVLAVTRAPLTYHTPPRDWHRGLLAPGEDLHSWGGTVQIHISCCLMQNSPQPLKTRAETENAMPQAEQAFHPRELLPCGESQAWPQVLQATLKPLRRFVCPLVWGLTQGGPRRLEFPPFPKSKRNSETDLCCPTWSSMAL